MSTTDFSDEEYVTINECDGTCSRQLTLDHLSTSSVLQRMCESPISFCSPASTEECHPVGGWGACNSYLPYAHHRNKSIVDGTCPVQRLFTGSTCDWVLECNHRSLSVEESPTAGTSKPRTSRSKFSKVLEYMRRRVDRLKRKLRRTPRRGRTQIPPWMYTPDVCHQQNLPDVWRAEPHECLGVPRCRSFASSFPPHARTGDFADVHERGRKRSIKPLGHAATF